MGSGARPEPDRSEVDAEGPGMYAFLAAFTHRGQQLSYDELCAAGVGKDKGAVQNARDRAVRKYPFMRFKAIANVGYELVSEPFGAPGVQLPPADVFGREREIDEVIRQLGPRCVLTVVALSGYGKTTVVRAALQRFKPPLGAWPEHGMYEVDLSNAHAGGLIAAVQYRLGRVQITGEGSAESLARALALESMLLFLDGAETVHDELEELIDALRAHAPNVGVVITTRRPIELAGFRTYELGGLPTHAGPDLARSGAAVQMFAKLVHLDPIEDGEDLQDIAAICRRVGGNPTDIQLAARRARTEAFKALARSLRANAEQRDRRTAQFRAFPHEERELLARLSVLGEAFVLDTAAARITGSDDVEHLRRRVEPFVGLWLQRQRVGHELHHFLDHQVREPAAEHLRRRPDLRRVVHLYVVTLVEEWTRPRPDEDQRAWVERVAAHHETIAGALVTEAALPSGTNLHLSVVPRLLTFWRITGRFGDGHRVMQEVLAAMVKPDPATRDAMIACAATMACLYEGRAAGITHLEQISRDDGPPRSRGLVACARALIKRDGSELDERDFLQNEALPAPLRVEAVTWRAWADYRQADYAAARRRFVAALNLAREHHDRRGIADATIGLAWVDRRACDLDAALNRARAALESARHVGDVILQADALIAIAEFERCARGGLDRARDACAEAEELTKRNGLLWVEGRILGMRGEIKRTDAHHPAHLEDAGDLLRRSLAAAKEWNDLVEQSWRLFNLGFVAAIEGDDEIAEARFKEALALAETNGDRWQELRCRQRLCRLQHARRECDLRVLVDQLREVAAEQALRGLFDDLAWTVLDLQVVLHEAGRPDDVAWLDGVRCGVLERIRFGHVDPRDDPDALDPWKRHVASSLREAQLAALTWDAERAAGHGVSGREPADIATEINARIRVPAVGPDGDEPLDEEERAA